MPTHCINFWVGEDDDGDDGDEGDKGDDGDDSDEGDGGYNMAILVMQRLLPGPTLRWDHSTKITGVAKDKNLARLLGDSVEISIEVLMTMLMLILILNKIVMTVTMMARSNYKLLVLLLSWWCPPTTIYLDNPTKVASYM